MGASAVLNSGQQTAGSYTAPGFPPAQGLYDPGQEKDSCGVGFVCHLEGRPSHDIVQQGIEVLKNLLHRGAAGAGGAGDGAGLLAQIPDQFEMTDKEQYESGMEQDKKHP